MNTVVVTGATSMMGSALIRSLLKHDVATIYAVVQVNTQNISRIPKDDRICFIYCDCENYDQLPKLIPPKCDTLFHFAWIHSKLTGRERYFDVEVGYQNIGQTLKVLESATALGCETFVGAGSQAEYGNRRELIQSPEDPSDPITAYAIAKDACRRMCMLKGIELGINVQWVRIFSVYGPHDRKNTLISTIIPKLCNNEAIELTACEQTWEYLFEEDAGEGLYYAGSTPYDKGSNIYCLGSGDAKPLKLFIEEMVEITGSKSEILFGSIPYSKDMVMTLQADISKLQENTGWGGPKVSFREGIRRCIDAWSLYYDNGEML